VTGRQGVGLVSALIPLLCAAPSHAQSGADDIYWHIDPNVRTCSMVIDPSLTQGQWETFTRQAGAMLTFKSLASAEPLGRLNFTLGLDYSTTPIDQRDPAWINTFTHPDADCPLGDQIEVPTLRGRLGVSGATDVSGYWTTAPGANYGLLGVEFKYAFLRESARTPAAAVTTSFTTLTGVPDFDFSVYSVGLLASKRLSMFAPYVGVREGVAMGTETTGKVDLKNERLALTQGFIGVTCATWKLGLAAEYDFAEVNTVAVMIGFHPRANVR